MKYSSWISKLTIRERALLLTGKDFWHTNGIKKMGLPSIMLTDGPHGVRKIQKDGVVSSRTVQSTCFPTASALACTWDRALMREIGNSIAEECIQEKVSVVLGPGVNIKRSPLCGRNFEYYSEDPVVTGELAAELINGAQEFNIGTSLKHFAVNSTETRRFKCNAVVDERALREIYLRAFEIAVKKAQPWTVMSAYNKVNGKYCTENGYLQDRILRKEWGFKGAVISDWMATDNRVKALNAGLDLEMPSTGYYNVNKIAQAYRYNIVTPETLNTSVSRVLELVDKAEQNLSAYNSYRYNQNAHHILAQKAAEKSIVLLKNDEDILPLKSGQKIAVIGNGAKHPIYQGFGSSKINSFAVDNVYDSLKEIFPDLSYAIGYTKDANEPESRLLEEAKAVAAKSDVAIVFVGACNSDVCEGFDRVDMRLSKAQTATIQAVCSVNKNVVIVVNGGSCVEMPWLNNVKAIVQTYLLGEGGGVAISNVISGKSCPSGKLAETFPYSINDTPANGYYTPDDNNNVQYRESILVGYRYYDKSKVPVMFPFGHGLSYTRFNYSNLKISSPSIKTDETLDVYFDVENIGSYDAEEIVQLYVAKGDTRVFRAEKELKGFERVELRAGEKKRVKITLDRSAFEYYSTRFGQWCVESGKYAILVGASSADVRLETEVQIDSTDNLISERDYYELSPSYFTANVKQAKDIEFEYLLNYTLDTFEPNPDIDRLTSDNTLSDAMGTPIGSYIEKVIRNTLSKLLDDDEIMQKLIYDSIMYNIPMKRMTSISKGAITEEMVNGFVLLLNSGDAKRSAGMVVKGVSSAIKNLLPMLIENIQ